MTDVRMPRHCEQCGAIFVGLFDEDKCQDCATAPVNDNKEDTNKQTSGKKRNV